MISISTPTFDLDGSLVAPAATAEQSPLSRRARRVATLDGGAVVSDLGFAVTDTDYDIRINQATSEQHDWLSLKLAEYQAMILACEYGCFLVLLANIKLSDGVISLTAHVIEKLSA